MADFQSMLNESKTKLVVDDSSNAVKDKQTGTYLTLRRSNFSDEAEEKRFFKNVEKLIRTSLEYKEWIAFIKDTLGLNICAFTGETDEETDDIEIHHHPLTLYDIVQSVTDTKIMNDQEFCSFDIAQEVIDLHFKLKVGFVPLLRSLHKKFHNGFLDIPINLVHGDYKYIFQLYHIRDNVLEKAKKYESITMDNVQYNWTKDHYIIIPNTELNEGSK